MSKVAQWAEASYGVYPWDQAGALAKAQRTIDQWRRTGKLGTPGYPSTAVALAEQSFLEHVHAGQRLFDAWRLAEQKAGRISTASLNAWLLTPQGKVYVPYTRIQDTGGSFIDEIFPALVFGGGVAGFAAPLVSGAIGAPAVGSASIAPALAPAVLPIAAPAVGVGGAAAAGASTGTLASIAAGAAALGKTVTEFASTAGSAASIVRAMTGGGEKPDPPMPSTLIVPTQVMAESSAPTWLVPVVAALGIVLLLRKGR